MIIQKLVGPKSVVGYQTILLRTVKRQPMGGWGYSNFGHKIVPDSRFDNFVMVGVTVFITCLWIDWERFWPSISAKYKACKRKILPESWIKEEKEPIRTVYEKFFQYRKNWDMVNRTREKK